jgi:hypothetical protein
MAVLVSPRRMVVLFPWVAVVAACARSETAVVPTDFPPLRYDFLTPIPLNVAAVTTELRFAPGSSDLGRSDPVDPAQALLQMGQDRLQTLGSGGRAVFIVQDASLIRSQGSYIGSFAVELDVYASDGTRGGFAEARVLRTRPIDSAPLAATLYDMTKALMEAMNVEFEYQVRRSLRDWLIPMPAPGAVSAPDAASPALAPHVEQQPLPPPPS